MINVILLKGKGSSLPISREELVAQLRSVLVARRTICGVAIRKLKHIRLNGRLVICNCTSHSFMKQNYPLDI